MSYQVLARKWRPKNFHELVGQDHVRKALVSALDNDRLHHAYLFTGTRGVGKTTIARIIAKCLNCETGVTSRPCGECTSCREINEGRFVDLIEVDAASRTKVEDTRELLDNVQYAPSRGRYKVYLIDEVHMLSTHSFNALLKTLEEPPPHVKFLLATTDPQKLPVTVLSRCLQFNLKNMPPERVVEHLTNVLTQEQIPFEEAALWQLGRAADGSMRDALSLTDQAIAYGQGHVDAAQVSEMLGLVDHRHVGALIDHLVNRDAKALLGEVARLSEQAADFETILSDMALYLHRMAVAQVLPDAVDNALGDREQVLSQAARLTAEDVQLYYQIAIKSQEDLPLAPDARSGFEMALIRMVAFAPQGVPSEGGSALPSQAAPFNQQAAPAGHQAESVGQVASPLAQPPVHGAEDEAKKKALVESEADESLIDFDAPAPAPAPVADHASAPQVAPAQPEPQISTPASAEPKLVKFSRPEPKGNPSPESKPDVRTDEAQERATVQNARATLGGGLRTVQFPSAGSEKTEQAAATPTQPSVQPQPQPPVQAQVASPTQEPADVPPWEELPVIPEQNSVAPAPAPEPAAYDESMPPSDMASGFEAASHPAPAFSDSSAPLNTSAPINSNALSAEPLTETPVDAAYQNMMPEPVSEQPRQAPELRDAKLPDVTESEITPMVGPCPEQLNTNQDWLQAFAHLPLKGLDRSLAKNAAMIGRQGTHLQFALKAVTENFLTPEREASWQQSIQTLFNEPLTIEISAYSTDLDTPEDYEAALKQTRQHQAEAIFTRDPVIQGLQQAFGAEVLTSSVEPLV